MSSARALLATQGADEAVSVNQRALVEKILARYSGEYTVYRELLQNADDAGAQAVEIQFTSDAVNGDQAQPEGTPNLRTPVVNITVRNDGIIFRDEDWKRLKKIAEGNPDETKIGAFGVGWYSLFSLTDDPSISSGNQVLGFFWKDGGDQLYVKTAVDPAGLANVSEEGKPWTTISIDLRERVPMEEPWQFSRFLTTCLGFTQSLKSISVYFDTRLLYRITKTHAPPRVLPLRPNLPSLSPLSILRIESINERPIQLRAEMARLMLQYSPKPLSSTTMANKSINVASGLASSAASVTSSFASRMLSAFAPKQSPSNTSSKSTLASSSNTPQPPSTPVPKDPFELLSATLFLRTVAAEMKVTPSSNFNNEMLRATKKALPKRTQYSLIWTGKDEFDANQFVDQSGEEGKSTSDEQAVRKVFSGLLSDLDTNGRVFIGFPTFQTTGCAASVAARFVSTVERESIDFQARHVADWNKELLWSGGILARTIYQAELEDISRIFNSKGMDVVGKQKLLERALHLMRFFSFTHSTPSPVVGQVTESSFFLSNKGSVISLMSQLGPFPADQVRLPNPALTFLKEIPVVPDLISTGAPRFLNQLEVRKIVREISLEDILADLGSHPLHINEAVDCFKWWIGLASDRSYNPSLLDRLKDAAMISSPDPSKKGEVSIFPLASFRAFINPKTIPVDLPIPEYTLPFELSRSISPGDLINVFRLQELTLLDWVMHLLSPAMVGPEAKTETNILSSPQFSEKVLNTLARSWTTLSVARQTELSTRLALQPLIPTRKGMSRPTESYFPNVLLFEDLPIVTFSSGSPLKGNLEKLLAGMGVRKHVELQLVFTRLVGGGDWSHIDLVKYLVSVRETLSTSEMDRLTRTACFPREGGEPVTELEEPVNEDEVGKKPKVKRHAASELYEPSPTLRALGLPLLEWTLATPKWRSTSDEAKFLFELGLARVPPVELLLKIASETVNPSRAEAALTYFFAEYANAGYKATYSPSTHAFPFVPSITDGKPTYSKPLEVFSNLDAALLGFTVLAKRMENEVGRLQLAHDPAPAALVASIVRNPPKTVKQAGPVFTYLSSQVSRFSKIDLAKLNASSIIPIERNGKVELASPSSCFFDTDASLPVGLKSLFATLGDFGPGARPFLSSVGVKPAPSSSEIAARVIEDPPKFLELCGSSERYLTVLRMLAVNYNALSSTLRSRLKLSAFFLGSRRVVAPESKTLLDDDEDEDSGSLSFELCRASSCVVNDDPAAMRAFQYLLQCPTEDPIEEFAQALGASKISRLVVASYRTHSLREGSTSRSVRIHQDVTQRTPLFLTEYGRGELLYESDWITQNLKVFGVGSIEFTRTLSFEGTTKRVTQNASAFVKLQDRQVHLFIADDLELDWYEVSTGLCKILLAPKGRSNDSSALLLFTILSTSMKDLKKRGFPVDRIVKQAERQAADLKLRQERQREQERASRTSLPADKFSTIERDLMDLFPDADPGYVRQVLESQKDNHVQNAANQMLSSDYPKRPLPPPPPRTSTGRDTSMDATPPHLPPLAPAQSSNSVKSSNSVSSGSGRSLLGDLKKKLNRGERPLIPPSLGGSGGMRPPTVSDTSSSTPTSTETIKSNIEAAIRASAPETDSRVSSAVQKTQVAEAETYCDTSAGADLVYVEDVSGLRFFVDQEISDGRAFARDHHLELSRFIQSVVLPVGKVYGLNPRALHVFQDLRGPVIAFNRNGSIFVNFRFYSHWFDSQVAQGHLDEALISMYHTLAHEIAHNLVKPHNAEHSYYFASLCEQKFSRMADLLTSVQRQSH